MLGRVMAALLVVSAACCWVGMTVVEVVGVMVGLVREEEGVGRGGFVTEGSWVGVAAVGGVVIGV